MSRYTGYDCNWRMWASRMFEIDSKELEHGSRMKNAPSCFFSKLGVGGM